MNRDRKKCDHCGWIKDKNEFRIDNRSIGGYSKNCLDCERNRIIVIEDNNEEQMQIEEIPKQKCLHCKMFKNKNEFDKYPDGRIYKTCISCLNFKHNKVKSSNKNIVKLYNELDIVSNSKFTIKYKSLEGMVRHYRYDFQNFNGNWNKFKSNLKKDLIVFCEKLLDITPVLVHLSIDSNYLNSHNKNFAKSDSSDRKYKLNFKKNLKTEVNLMVDELFNKILEDYNEESGLTLKEIKKIELSVIPQIIGNGGTYIKLPQKINRTKSILNIKNYDNKCFIWCVLAFLFPSNNFLERKKPSSYFQYQNKINTANLTFPVCLNQIQEFEELNNLTINVYGLIHFKDDTSSIITKYPFKKRLIPDEKRHINLLLYKNHYSLILKINSFFRHIDLKNEKFVCINCSNFYSSENALEQHKNKCIDLIKNKKFKLKNQKNIQFENFHKMNKIQFIIYADFESYFNSTNKENTDCIEFKNEHKPLAFSFKRICSSNNKYTSEIETYIGNDADDVFTNILINDGLNIEQILKTTNINCILSEDEKYDFENSKFCYLCNEEFSSKNYKVIDHDHLNGKYRGAAHNKCNLIYLKKRFVIPIVFHNLEGYDIHLFIEQICKKFNEIFIIPKSKEKYLSLTCGIKNSNIKFKFIDSLHFFTGSLNENAKKLSIFQYIPDEKKDLRFKQFFPYSYIDSFDKIFENQLPQDLKYWYNDITKSTISQNDLDYANFIFNKYNCKNIGDYIKIYLETDVLLLTEIFEQFRNVSIKTYKLDPAWYYSTPGMAWDAALSFTKIKLELLKDEEMVDFFLEKGSLRGGISTVCRKKFSIANNKYLDSYDKNKESSFIGYFDANNLYGYIMTSPLPISNFHWLVEDEINDLFFKLSNKILILNEEIGYILECDLEYPLSKHKEHVELPLAPEHYNNKLCATLFDKNNYKIHIKNLIFYLENGIILKKIYKGIVFKQQNWLKGYIDNNNKLRTSVTDEIEKNYYKLMNNAVFGKTMENVFNRKNFKILNNSNKNKINKLINQSDFKKEYIVSEETVILEFEKKEVIFDKPIYVGFSILELSKLHMYFLHYSIIKKHYNNKALLMYMDTDSLIYELKTEDMYLDIKNMINYFDTSVYKKDNIAYNNLNAGKLGLLKDEFAKDPIVEFCALRSKVYSIITNSKNIQKCKGINKSVMKNLTHDKYLDCFINGGVVEIKQVKFKSEKHKIYTIELEKEALCRFDDKRQIDASMGDFYTYTIPWGFLNNKMEDYDLELDENLNKNVDKLILEFKDTKTLSDLIVGTFNCFKEETNDNLHVDKVFEHSDLNFDEIQIVKKYLFGNAQKINKKKFEQNLTNILNVIYLNNLIEDEKNN